jgi:large subunit ribosomal protein L25
MTAVLRTDTGKNNCRRLRAGGSIPAVLYGGKEPLAIAVDKMEFQKNFRHISENVLIDLDIKGGEAKEVLIKDYQVDPVTNRLTHLDFFEIVRGKKIHTRIPVSLTGTPIGVRLNGGMLDQLAHEVQVECLPKDIPEVITIDITGLDVNQALHISNINLPEGVVSLDSPETVIAVVFNAKAEAAEGGEAVAADAPAEGAAG